MKRLLKQFSAGFLAIALIFSAIPPIQANAASEVTVTGITFEDMEKIEGNDGEFWESEDYGEWFYYDQDNPNYTIQLSDGSSLTREQLNDSYGDEDYYAGNSYFYYNGIYHYISYSSDQAADAQWEAGKSYNVTGSVYAYNEETEESTFKCENSFSCSIIRLPIEDIVFEPLEIVEGDGGYWSETESGEYYYYYPINYAFTVKFSDDTEDYVNTYDGEYEGEYVGFYYNDEFVYINFDSEQSYSNPWTAGNSYKATATVGSFEKEFDVTIVDIPIASITVEPKEVLEHTEGYWDYDWLYDDDEEGYKSEEYYRYDEYSTWNYTVKFSDGTPDVVHTYDDERRGFYYKDYYVNISFDTNQSYKNQWKGGNTYKVDITAGAFKTTYDFVIVKTPVKSVEVKPVKIFQNTGGYFDHEWEYVDDQEIKKEWYYYSISGSDLEYTVTLQDGTVLTSDSSGEVYYNEEWYYPQIKTEQSYENQWGVGQNEAVISILGYEQAFKVNILCGEHTWDKGTTTAAATCTSKGEITYKCTNKGCTETKTTLIPTTGHSWNKDFTVDKEATCTAEGSKSIHCANCKATKDKTVIPAKGHAPGAAATCTAPQTCTTCQAMLAAPTGHTAGPEATCTTAQNCATCGAELAKVKGHAVALREKAKATADDAGEIVETCICGQVMKTTAIAKISTVKIAKTKYAYAGKAIQPAVTVKDSAGKVLTAGTDYKVTYKNANKVGKATATVKFIGNYSGSKQLTYTINPAKPTIKKPVAAKKALTAKWSKVSKQVTGYEIMVATNKKFTKNKKTVTVKSFKTTSKKISKLKSKKMYYVKVRTYKTVGKTKYYSDWSAVKSVKVK